MEQEKKRRDEVGAERWFLLTFLRGQRRVVTDRGSLGSASIRKRQSLQRTYQQRGPIATVEILLRGLEECTATGKKQGDEHKSGFSMLFPLSMFSAGQSFHRLHQRSGHQREAFLLANNRSSTFRQDEAI